MRTLGFVCCLSLVVTVCEGRSEVNDAPNATHSDCANWDVDNFAPPTDDWCYIRMYKCANIKVPYWMINAWGISNTNTGDLAWGAGGHKLGEMTCVHYGDNLEVWRVAVKRDLMKKEPPPRYAQCNHNVCGCGLNGVCHGGQKPAVDFGWRYKDQHNKTAKESKRQFSLPGASRGDQWKDLCLERVLSKDCVTSTTYNEDNMASVSAIFKRDVFDKPIEACRSLSTVDECGPSTSKLANFFV